MTKEEMQELGDYIIARLKEERSKIKLIPHTGNRIGGIVDDRESHDGKAR